MTGGEQRTDRPRVVVTGMGVISAAGCDLDSYWSTLLAGNVAPAATTVTGFDPLSVMRKSEVRRSDSRIHFALGAAVQAVADAGSPTLDPLRTGVIIGNVHGAAERVETETDVMRRDGRKAVSPLLAGLDSDNAPAAAIALHLQVRGVCQMVGGACASGTYALTDAARLITAGVCDRVIAGATAAYLPEVLLAAYENLRVVSPSGWVRPFDLRRDGFVYSPGAAVLVLERAELAEARGARVYGEIAGGASTNDAFHPVQQSGTGAIECMRLALADAELEPAAVVHVNAHGSATQANDQIEADGIREVFGGGAVAPSVTSIKGVTGHSLGAAGSFEAVAVLLSFRDAVLPPAGVDLDLDPAIDLDIVAEEPRAWTPGPTISNSFGLGGQNGTVVLLPPAPVL